MELLCGMLLSTAIGKPMSSPMKVILIGTLAPSTDGWWPDLIKKGSNGSTYVQAIKAILRSLWDQWSEKSGAAIRCGMWTTASGNGCLMERDEARADSRLKARFLSYRLNYPSGDPSQVLLTVQDWKELNG